MESEIFWPSAKDLAQRFGVHVTTARRWRRERNAPEAVMLMLAADLGMFSKAWRGWRIQQDELVSPEALACTPGDIRSLPFVRLQIATHRSENVQLRNEIEQLRQAPALDEQPMPDSWEIRVDYG